jgi:GST-like protein
VIELYYWPTPNGWKASIMLEECGLPYTIHKVDIGAGDQFKPEFLRISPNNRMPAIVDLDPMGGGKPIAIFESGAILEYLAEKSGKFLPRPPSERFHVLAWVYWQVSNLGPMMGNANHFKNYAKSITSDPKQLEYAMNRFSGEVDRLSGVMDAQLSVNTYLAGDDYTIADIITWPWAILLESLEPAVWTTFPHVKRWIDLVGARPAVLKGRNLHKEWGEHKYSDEEAQARRNLLFNQTNDKVRAAREQALKLNPRS